jgi:hypothetical protein
MTDEITIQLEAGESPEACDDDRQGVPRALVELVEPHGGRVQPLHPGSTDERLSSYYRIEAASPEARERLLEVLRGSALVRAAYVKPTDEPP